MTLRNAFENLGLDSTLQAIRDRLPTLLGDGRMPVRAHLDGSLSGQLTAVGQALLLNHDEGHSAWAVQLAGTFSAGSKVAFEGSTDGGLWYPLNGRLNSLVSSLNATSNTLTWTPEGPGPLHFRGNLAGAAFFRVRCVALAAGDAIDVTARSSGGVGATFLNAPLPSGSNFIGYTGEEESEAAKQGRFRWSGGRAQTDVTKPNASMTIANPLGSGQDILLVRYQVEVDADADIVVLYDATSTGTIRKLTNPNRRTTHFCPAEVRVGAGVLTGGEVQDYIRRASTNSPVAVGPFRHRIIPGTTWTVRFLGPGASNNVWFTCGLFCVEEGQDLL